MIKDNLLHIDYYNYLSPGIYWGLNYLKNTDFSTMENGKYEIKEGKAWAIVQDYNSKPEAEGKYEAHRKFVDIQFIVEGEELIGVGNIDDFEAATEYDEEKDIIFLIPKKIEQGGAKTELKKVIAGEYMILMPKDAHMSSIAVDSPSFVKKVVLKIII